MTMHVEFYFILMREKTEILRHTANYNTTMQSDN